MRRKVTNRLVEGAVPIINGDTILLQEILLDQPRDVERDLVGLSKRALSNELNDLGEFVLLLEDLLGRVAIVEEVGLGSLVVGLEDTGAVGTAGSGGMRGKDNAGDQLFRVRDVPVDGGEMLALRELPREGTQDVGSARWGESTSSMLMRTCRDPRRPERYRGWRR